MRLVTYDDGKVGYVDGEEIVRLDVPTMREWFERGGADETGERVALAGSRLQAPIVPTKFFHTAGNFREHEEDSKVVNWSHEIAPWIVFFQNEFLTTTCSPRNVQRSQPRTSRRTPSVVVPVNVHSETPRSPATK